MNQWTIHSAEEMTKPVEWLIEALKLSPRSPTVITLQGDLGAGKTTFTQTLARVLGITETVTSPTFVIQKNYPILLPHFPFTKLVHIDAYRIENENEMRTLGWERLVQEGRALIVIEWSERIEGLLNVFRARLKENHTSFISFTFKVINESTRELTAQTHNMHS